MRPSAPLLRRAQVADSVCKHFAHVPGLAEDLRVVEAERAKAGASMSLVAFQVGRLSRDGAVVGEAVGLDDEAELGPVKVDAVAAEAMLAGRPGKAGGEGDRQEAALERSLGAAEGLRVEEAAEAASAQPGDWVEEVAKAIGRDEPEMVGRVDRVFEPFVVIEAGGEVDEDRERVADGDAADEVRRSEAIPAMQADLAAAMEHAARHRDLDQAAALWPEAPERRAAAVAEPRLGSTGQSRRHETAKLVEIGAPDRVDAAVNLMEAPGAEPVADRIGREPQGQELRPRHNRMLPPGQCPRVRGAALKHSRAHDPANASAAWGSPPGRGGEGGACETWGMASSRIPDPTESVRHQLRPLFDQIVIKELDQDRVRRSGLVVPPGTHEPPPEQGIVLAVGPGLDWWASAGVEMPVSIGDHVVFPAAAGVWVEIDEERLLVCRVTQILGVLESAPVER